MKGFKFRLKALYRLRSFEEENCKIELGKINKEIAILEERIRACEESISTAYDSQKSIAEKGISAREIQFYPYYVEGRLQSIKNMNEQIEDLVQKRERKMEELSVLRAKSKVLEKLKEQEKKKYKKALEKEDEKNLEEEVQKWLRYQKNT